MKPVTLLLILLFGAAHLPDAEEVPRLPDEYNPANWTGVGLKLSQAATLKDTFESGLRPYRFPGLENTTLEVKHLALSIALASGKNLPVVHLELLRIKPFQDGEIAALEGFTPTLTLPEAPAEIVKWLPWGTNGRTEKDVDDYLDAVRADYLDFDDPSRGLAHGFGIG